MWGGLRLGFRTDVSRKEAKTQRVQGKGGKVFSLNVGWFDVWGPPGPRSRAQRGVYAIVMVLGNLRGLRARRPAPREGRAHERSEASMR